MKACVAGMCYKMVRPIEQTTRNMWVLTKSFTFMDHVMKMHANILNRDSDHFAMVQSIFC